MNENMKPKGTSFTFPCKDVVTCVEFCPYEAASQLIAFGGQLRINVGACRFQVTIKLYTLRQFQAHFSLYNYKI